MTHLEKTNESLILELLEAVSKKNKNDIVSLLAKIQQKNPNNVRVILQFLRKESILKLSTDIEKIILNELAKPESVKQNKKYVPLFEKSLLSRFFTWKKITLFIMSAIAIGFIAKKYGLFGSSTIDESLKNSQNDLMTNLPEVPKDDETSWFSPWTWDIFGQKPSPTPTPTPTPTPIPTPSEPESWWNLSFLRGGGSSIPPTPLHEEQ